MSESTSPNGTPRKSARKTKSATKAPKPSSKAAEPVTPGIQVRALHIAAGDRLAMIATAAYYRAERRRFEAGHELEDWLNAEAEIEALLRTRLEGAGREAGTA